MPSELCQQCRDARRQINGLFCIKLNKNIEYTNISVCTLLNAKDMNNELAIVKQENIAQIVQAAPQSYKDNALSHDKCIEAGNNILNLIEQNGGNMTEELDQQAANFIEKARKTVKKMNERRSPVTKLFDEVRTAFTKIENDIDPAKSNTIPYKLQQYRNSYAAKKHAEEEKRRQEEYAKQQMAQAIEHFKLDIENNLKAQFQFEVNRNLDTLKNIDNSITIENYEQSFQDIENFSANLSSEWLTALRANVHIPYGMTAIEASNIEKQIYDSLSKTFNEQYAFEIEEMKTYIIDRLPSKKANLERIVKANNEEAERLKAEMLQKERQEAERLEKERAMREEEERKQAEMKKQISEMDGLFTGQATMTTSQSKIKVTKKIQLLNPEGILPIIMMWWTSEGCKLTVDELTKIFKKQITFCEKQANSDGTFIQDESVDYIDNVKAK